MRPLLIQCFHVLIVLIAHQVERCISMLFLVSFFAQVFFHSVNLLPVRPAFWAAFGGEEKCSLGKSTHVHYVKLHVQEKRTMKMNTHKKSAQ